MRPDIVVDRREGLARTAADRFEALARSALAARGRFSCALPGGSVAETLFPAFARLALPWPQVDVFFGDERAVPPTDPESNVGLARRLWLDAVPAVVHAMPSDRDDLTAAAAAYAAELRTLLGDPPRLDLALLGVGPDGHVCSLFPGHPLLAERARLVAEITDSPKPPPRRLTLTLPVLAAARAIWIGAFGEAKAQVIGEAVGDAASRLPVALAARSGPPTTFLLDPDAASALPSPVERR
jgi:6-phosphogluconolactonase